MSGGSMDYLTYKVDEVASDLQNKNNTPLQRAFGKHLEKVAKALHDVEWVWSGDYGKGDEEDAIKEVLGDVTDEKALDILKSDAVELIEQLSNKNVDSKKEVYGLYESLRTLEITHCDDIATCADGCCYSEGYHFRCNGKHKIFITHIDKEVLKDIIKFVSPGVKIIEP